MSTRNERFNASMSSLDELSASFEDPTKANVFSDKGKGVERMVTMLDYDVTAEERLQSALEDKLFIAEMRLVDANRRYLIPVLLLIVENGKDREKSIEKVSRSTYFRHRDALLDFFCETFACYRHRGA